MGRPSKKTFGDLRKICEKNGLTFLSDLPNEDKIFNVNLKNGWQFRCKCGKEFASNLQVILMENTKSCGCVGNANRLNHIKKTTKHTFEDIREEVAP
jgi:hypothetical protein